jgi:hypothetical protein
MLSVAFSIVILLILLSAKHSSLFRTNVSDEEKDLSL